MARKTAIRPPSDLDEAALAAWRELESRVSESQADLLANLCRNRSNLIAVRTAKAASVRDGTFRAMTVAKNGTQVPCPFIKTETRLLALELRMLAALGIGRKSELDELFSGLE